MYFPLPVEESDYAKENNVDMSKLFVIRDLIVIHLTDPNGNYGLDPKLKRFVHIEEESLCQYMQKLWRKRLWNKNKRIFKKLEYTKQIFKEKEEKSKF